MRKSTLFATVALSLAAAFAANVAQAREADVQWSVTIGSPAFSQPAPHYTRPYPVYARPAPLYTQPVPMNAPRDYYRRSVRWDHDGDGIPNRYDRVYNPRWDRDGDGVPNRRDRHDRQDRQDHSRLDRDGDGMPGRHDRSIGPGWRDR